MNKKGTTEAGYRNDFGDILSFSLAALARNRAVMFMCIITALALPLTWCLFPPGSLAHVEPAHPRVAAEICAGFHVFKAALAVYAVLSLSVLAVALIKDCEDYSHIKTMFPYQKVRLSADHLSHVSEHGERTCSWKGVSGIIENRRLIMIHLPYNTGNSDVLLVPKRAFGTAEESRAFQDRAASLWREAHPNAKTPSLRLFFVYAACGVCLYVSLFAGLLRMARIPK